MINKDLEMQLIRGQKLKLSDVLNNSLSFSLATTPPSNLNLEPVHD